MRFTGLPRRRGELLDDPIALIVLAQHIDARRGHVFVVAHHGSRHRRLRGQVVFVQDVPGQNEVMLLAPLLARDGEVFQKELLQQLDIVPLDLRNSLAVHLQEEFGQTLFEVVAEALLELLEQLRRERRAKCAVIAIHRKTIEQRAAMRLIGKDALD